MTPDERAEAMCFWNSIVIAGALFYFGNTWWVAISIALIVFVSALLGYGRRHLMRLGFASLVFTIAIASGAIPSPEKWPDVISAARTSIASGSVAYAKN